MKVVQLITKIKEDRIEYCNIDNPELVRGGGLIDLSLINVMDTVMLHS